MPHITHKERIELTDNFMTIMTKLAEGNPGAITALAALYKSSAAIDPQSIFGSLSAMVSFDTHGIYGSAIWILYSDKCKRDVRKVLVLLRATQLGFFSHNKLKEMANDQTRSVNLTDEEWKTLDEKVCEQLKEFARP